jgi:hypothetical protein
MPHHEARIVGRWGRQAAGAVEIDAGALFEAVRDAGSELRNFPLASMLFSRQLGAGASGGILGVCAALVLIRYRRRPARLPRYAQAACGSQLTAGIGLDASLRMACTGNQ